MAALFRYEDVDGDKLAVFDADIPGLGKGVNIRTSYDGCSLPMGDVPALIKVLTDVIDPDYPHVHIVLASHDGYAEHSHEVRPDHRGVKRL